MRPRVCLDEVALTLIRDTTSKLVIIGKHSADETPDAAAQRDLNVAQYLTHEKGVDPARIEMRTGGELNRSLDNIMVPAGANFIPGDTNTFDSNSIKRQGQPYAPPKFAARFTNRPNRADRLCTTHGKESLGPLPIFLFFFLIFLEHGDEPIHGSGRHFPLPHLGG